jgi:hypothetical protein
MRQIVLFSVLRLANGQGCIAPHILAECDKCVDSLQCPELYQCGIFAHVFCFLFSVLFLFVLYLRLCVSTRFLFDFWINC